MGVGAGATQDLTDLSQRRQFQGSLHNKLKSDLSEIADEMHIKKHDQLTKNELINAIRSELDQHEHKYKSSPEFKGLYVSRPGRSRSVPLQLHTDGWSS